MMIGCPCGSAGIEQDTRPSLDDTHVGSGRGVRQDKEE